MDRQVRLRSINTIVLHVNMSTTTDGYLQRDFVKFRFNKCTSTSGIRQVPHRMPSTSTNDTGSIRTCTTTIPCMSPSTTTPMTQTSMIRVPLPPPEHLRNVKYYFQSTIPRTSTSTTVARTTTSTTARVPLLPSTSSFHPENARFEGITAETTFRERMHVLYEMLVFAPCPSCLSFPCH